MITSQKFNKLLVSYGAEIRSHMATRHTGELHYRNSIGSFLSDFAKLFNESDLANGVVSVRHEDSLKDKGRPDFTLRLDDTRTIGYIECKRIGANLEKHAISKQVTDYASVCDNVIVTDGVKFKLVRNKTIVSFAAIDDRNRARGGGG